MVLLAQVDCLKMKEQFKRKQLDKMAELPHSLELSIRRPNLGYLICGSVVSVAIVLLILYQSIIARRYWLTPGFMSIYTSHKVFAFNATMILAWSIISIRAAPKRRKFLAYFIACSSFSVTILTAILTRNLISLTLAAATLSCMWSVGQSFLSLKSIRASAVSRAPLASLSIGFILFCLGLLALGGLGLLRTWVVGPIMLAIFASAAVKARKEFIHERAKPGPEPTRVDLLAAGSLSLIFGWASIYCSAPEIQYDALYGKGWLPAVWAAKGRIGFDLTHPVVNNNGFGYMSPVPGHLFGASATGRYLQLLLCVCLMSGVWRFLRQTSPLSAPIVTVLLAISPHILWQASTANDDISLILLVLAPSIGVLSAQNRKPTLSDTFVLAMMCGGALSGKLHLAPFALALLFFWTTGVLNKKASLSLLAAASGFLLTSLPLLIARWIATGNPLFPQFNNIFRSKYYAPINDKLNLPFMSGGAREFLKLPITLIASPYRSMEAVPTGVFGFLVVFLFIALAVGWIGKGKSWMVWAATTIAFAGWWNQVRYLRYLLPYCFVGAILLAPMLDHALAQTKRLRSAIEGTWIVFASVVMFASSLAAFWNIPGKVPIARAFDKQTAAKYLDDSLTMYQMSIAANRLAKPGDLIVGELYTRTLLNLSISTSPDWEFAKRIELRYGPVVKPPAETYKQWRSLGASWIAVHTSKLRTGGYSQSIVNLVKYNGHLAWAGKGTALYRLTDHQEPFIRTKLCNVKFSAEQNCWGIPLDATPGLSSKEAASGVSQSLPTCSGVTYELRLDQGEMSIGTVALAVRNTAGDLLAYVQDEAGGRNDSFVALTPPGGGTSLTLTIWPAASSTIQNVDLMQSSACP